MHQYFEAIIQILGTEVFTEGRQPEAEKLFFVPKKMNKIVRKNVTVIHSFIHIYCD